MIPVLFKRVRINNTFGDDDALLLTSFLKTTSVLILMDNT